MKPHTRTHSYGVFYIVFCLQTNLITTPLIDPPTKYTHVIVVYRSFKLSALHTRSGGDFSGPKAIVLIYQLIALTNEIQFQSRDWDCSNATEIVNELERHFLAFGLGPAQP